MIAPLSNCTAGRWNNLFCKTDFRQRRSLTCISQIPDHSLKQKKPFFFWNYFKFNQAKPPWLLMPGDVQNHPLLCTNSFKWGSAKESVTSCASPARAHRFLERLWEGFIALNWVVLKCDGYKNKYSVFRVGAATEQGPPRSLSPTMLIIYG